MLHTFKYIFLLVILTGCVTEKRRAKICNTCALKESRKDSIIVKTQTVPVFVPGEPGPIVYLPNPCALLCDEFGKIRPGKTFTATAGHQTITATTSSTGLTFSTSTGSQTAAATVTNSEHFSSTVKDNVRYIPCTNERTSFDGFCRWFFYIVGGAGALYALYIYIRRAIHIPRPP